jgi:hypothetical protein
MTGLTDTSASLLEQLDFEPGPDPSPPCEARAALLGDSRRIVGSVPCERRATRLVKAGPCRSCTRMGRRFFACDTCWDNGRVVACRYCCTQWSRDDFWSVLARLG